MTRQTRPPKKSPWDNDPGRLATEPEPGSERVGSRAVAIMIAFAFTLCVLVAAYLVNTPASRAPRLTCPAGYALVGGPFQKMVCAPGYVEPVRR